MASATSPQNQPAVKNGGDTGPVSVTLLELVTLIGATSRDDREVVRSVLSLLERGRVCLRGCFRDTPSTDFED